MALRLRSTDIIGRTSIQHNLSGAQSAGDFSAPTRVPPADSRWRDPATQTTAAGVAPAYGDCGSRGACRLPRIDVQLSGFVQHQAKIAPIGLLGHLVR